MKKIFLGVALLSLCSVKAQNLFTPNQKVNYKNFNSKKETLLQKEIIKLGDFKGFALQKIILKDLSDQSTYTVFGMMTFHETFDSISKETLTFEKDELSRLIQALENLELNSKKKPENETRLKYTTHNGIEIGSIYDNENKTWNHYFKKSSQLYINNAMNCNTNEIKELIQLLKKAEKTLE